METTDSNFSPAHIGNQTNTTLDRDRVPNISQGLVFTVLYNISNTENDSVPSTEEPPYQQFYDNAQFVTGLICYPILCLLGLVGGCCILAVMSQKSMHTSTNVYLCALAVSDMIKLINDFLYFLTILLLKYDPPAGNKAYGYLYPYAHFILNISVCVSSWLTVSVAVERYILVCHPTRAKSLITISRAKILSATIFILMILVAMPSALRYKTVTDTRVVDGVNITKLIVNLTPLWKDQTFVVAFNWVQSLLRSIIPLFILIFMNAFIINALRKTRANKKMASRNKITIMLIIVIICFTVCITPDAIMSAFFNLGYTESKNNLVKGVREITDMLLVVNAAINFYLYIIFNKIFRDQFLRLFCGNCYKGNIPPEENKYKRLPDSKPQPNGEVTSESKKQDQSSV